MKPADIAVPEKYYLALKCLLAAFTLSPSDPTAHEQTIRFRHALQKDSSEATSPIIDLADSTLPPPYNSASAPLATLNEDFISIHNHSVSHTHAFVKARQLLDPASRPSNEDAMIETLEESWGATLQDALLGLKVLRELGSGRETQQRFIGKAKGRWPEAERLLERELGR